jgi:signal transduction histidine kinase
VPRTNLWLRVFVALLLAILPPIVLLLAAEVVTEAVFGATNANLVAVVVFLGALGWAGILALIFTGGLADEVRSFLSLAERGADDSTAEGGDAYRQMALSLDERNRQVATLAREASRVPIDDDPRAVVRSLTSAVRVVMRDPTWRCAVLTSEAADLLPVGVYHGLEEDRAVEPIGELEQWAAVTGADRPARHVEGPWGGFAVADVAVSDRFGAILYAPWEGRLDPSPAEIALLTLVGQHAATALEHSLLYGTVRRQADELNRMARIQADFLRGVTHDLQTPLTSIGALATEIRAEGGMSEEARDDLDAIVHQADRLRRMVSQLLVASRLEAGVVRPQQEVFAVPPVVKRTWAALRADRPFELDVAGDPHLAVADPDRFEQVIWALLDNAVKYSTRESAIVVRISPEGEGQLCVSVADRGMGMDAETRTAAFDQFYRSNHARELVPDGSGVGLYAARGLVEAMGGTISIDSELGQGTTIHVTLPAERANADGSAIG